MIKVTLLYFLVLSVSLVLDVFNSPELAFLFILLLVPMSLSYIENRVLIFFGGMIFFVCVSVGLALNEINVLLKDCWYFIKPFVYFLVVYAYARRVRERGCLEYVLYTVALIHFSAYMFGLIFSPGGVANYFILTADDFRDTYGKGSFLYVYGVIFSIERFMSGAGRSYLGGSLIFLLGIAVSQSRFFTLCILIYFLVRFFPYYKFHISMVFSSLLLVLWLSIPNYDSRIFDAGVERDSLLGKAIFSVYEIKPQNLLLDSDIHARWRGYETFKAMDSYITSGYFYNFFGLGFGSVVEIDFDKRAGDGSGEVVSNLQWLHNGYSTILLKSGIVGLFFIISLVVMLARLSLFEKALAPSAKLDRGMIIFMLYYFVLSTFVMGGVFAKNGLLVAVIMTAMAVGRVVSSESSISSSEC
jgi:hypothetical protein